MNFYELSMRSLVEEAAIANLFERCLGVSRANIGSELDYCERLAGKRPLELGLTVLSSEKGYRTLARWVQSSELAPASLLKLAAESAQTFATEVAVADVAEPTEFAIGQYLVVSSDGRVFSAIEQQNSDVFELEKLPGERRIEDVIALANECARLKKLQ